VASVEVAEREFFLSTDDAVASLRVNLGIPTKMPLHGSGAIALAKQFHVRSMVDL